MDDPEPVSALKIYSYDHFAIIANPESKNIRQIRIYDILGNLIINQGEVHANPYRIFINGGTGYYVVEVLTDEEIYTEKVFIIE